MPGQELTTIVSVIMATLATSYAIDLWLQLKSVTNPDPRCRPRSPGRAGTF